MKNQNTPKIAVIGFGEAGSSLCKGWGLSDVRAFDIKQHGHSLLAAEKVAQMSAAGVIIGDDAADIANREGLLQVRDEGAMDAWVAAAVEAHPQAAEDFASGKDAAVGRLMGEVMKQSGGQADASAVREKLIATLRS